MTLHATDVPSLRDRLTWLMYLSLGAHACFQHRVRPVLPFLRADPTRTATLPRPASGSGLSYGIIPAPVVVSSALRFPGSRQAGAA